MSFAKQTVCVQKMPDVLHVNFRMSNHKRLRKPFSCFCTNDSTREENKKTTTPQRNDSDTAQTSKYPPTSPTELVEWGGQLPSGRRVFAGASFMIFATLGSNFLGSTSALLSSFPKTSRDLKLDLIYPVEGFRRCIEQTTGFEFLYPETWVGDQTLLYRAINRAEEERSLDPPSLRTRRRSSVFEPLVAFGPPGSEGELNVSVVVAPVAPGFKLEAFGSPSEVGNRILTNVIAPPSSDKTAILLNATQRKKGDILYYTLEFTVQGPSFFRHNLAVYAGYNDSLYSLNAQSAEKDWQQIRKQFEVVASSFELTQ